MGGVVDTDKPADINQQPFANVAYNASNDAAFATLQESLVSLSEMADSKANIMITVCSILLTLAVARLEQGVFVGAIAVFAAFCVPALVFSILTVLPSPAHSEGLFKKAGRSAHFNPLFFMHYTQVSLDEFNTEVDRMLRSPKELYKDLSKDVYYAGLVLRLKKYRYLRWSYLALLAGVLGGAAVFAAELLMSR